MDKRFLTHLPFLAPKLESTWHTTPRERCCGDCLTAQQQLSKSIQTRICCCGYSGFRRTISFLTRREDSVPSARWASPTILPVTSSTSRSARRAAKTAPLAESSTRSIPPSFLPSRARHLSSDCLHIRCPRLTYPILTSHC